MEKTLYVVATPIGNLGDITLRALETLKQVDFIICEDKRVTGNLLKHFEISKPLISLNAYNEANQVEPITARLILGETAALVSDAGTPTVSDPGVRFINFAIKCEINVVSIPGPSALTAALSIAGLPTDSFLFEGFLPQKKGRQKKLKVLADEEKTIVLYESVHRIEKFINEAVEFFPERFIVVCRELTKKFEETWRGFPSELKEQLKEKNIKGEFVIVIAPKDWKVK